MAFGKSKSIVPLFVLQSAKPVEMEMFSAIKVPGHKYFYQIVAAKTEKNWVAKRKLNDITLNVSIENEVKEFSNYSSFVKYCQGYIRLFVPREFDILEFEQNRSMTYEKAQEKIILWKQSLTPQT